MGGGGFMQNALNINRKDRAQRAARRKKFKGDNRETVVLDTENGSSLEFPEIPKEQIALERKRIQVKHLKNRKRNTILIVVFMVLTIGGLAVLYSVSDGFEHWEFLN